ncbi:hypothetical protein [Lentilactobacillus sp. Marseille-Q4993]|uniref:hypothetical protein n=1 Tax=Lentilactobacillus sp. Marseille-Q4993 TaxID=3039492 RepID=UPI0024BC77E8|nr:hypothetical protein [Lentilactobacillus sp. Marseille-Q4993]
MKAVFLLTSLDGIRKPNFSKQLTLLQEESAEIVIVVCQNRFDDIWKAEKEIKRVTEGKVDFELTTLYDIYANEKGVKLNSDDLVDLDLSTLSTYEGYQGQRDAKRYVDDAGQIKAESLYDEDGALIHTVYFDEMANIIQVNDYTRDGNLFGIDKYDDDYLTESLLLNKNGELIFRFSNQQSEKKVNYRLSSTSVIETPTQLLNATSDNEKSLIKDYEANLVKRVTKVVSYIDFKRYENISAFYNRILTAVNTEENRVYMDLDDSIEASKYLAGKQIFNY